MDCTRRSFASHLGLALSCAAGAGSWNAPEAQAGFSPAPDAEEEEHSKLPMTTHASGNAENRLGAARGVWTTLMAGNQRFVEGKLLTRDVVGRRSEVLPGQHPQVVVLACSDSRVSPALIFDQGLGDLFEIRTAGNVADPVAMGSIEYALIHLPVRVLLILGHEKCGAVAAAVAGARMPTANLQAVVDKIAPAIAKVPGDPKSEAFLRHAVEANVVQCAVDLLANSSIVLRETAANNVEMVKAVYSLATGQVRRLAE